jgi:glucose dehydrogenase
MRSNSLPGAVALLLWTGISVAASPLRAAGDVDAARLQNAAAESQNWFAGGRDIDGTFYSPLASIDGSIVKDLGFAWT